MSRMGKTSRSKHALPILLEYAQSQIWLVHYPTLQRMVSIAENHCNGIQIAEADLVEITAARDQRAAERADQREKLDISGDTAIIEIDGVVAKYSRLVNGCSQPRGTSLEALNEQLDAAMEDPRVRSIFLRIESPGGSGAGLADFADRIFEASHEKPIIAFADDLAASAAYWIGSQANRFYANQSAFVGSIGVYSVLVDSSAAAESEGFKVHIVKSGANKGVGVAGVPITGEQLDMVQVLIDQSFEQFIAAVLRGRSEAGLTEKTLRPIADGRVVKADDAKAAGLIDGIMSLAQAFNSARPNPRTATSVAAASIENEAATAAAQQDQQDKEHQMADKNETKDQAAEVEAATNAERERISELNAALGGNDALAETLAMSISKGHTLTEAKAAAFDTLQIAHAAEIEAKDAELTEAKNRLEAIAKAGEGDIEAAEAPDAGEEAASTSDDGKAETYQAAVDRKIADGAKPTQANRDAAVEFPKSHRAWIDRDTADRDAKRQRR